MSTGAYIALASIGIFTVVTWVFIVRYFLRPWRSTPEGKTIMFMKVCLAIVGTLLFVFRFLLSDPEWADLRWITYSIVFLIMTWLMFRYNKHLLKRKKNVRSTESR